MEFYIKNIINFRNLRGFSQEYMGELMGVSQQNYGQIERGKKKLTVDELLKIISIFNVKPNDILTERAEPFQVSEPEGQYETYKEKYLRCLEEKDALYKQIVNIKSI